MIAIHERNVEQLSRWRPRNRWLDSYGMLKGRWIFSLIALGFAILMITVGLVSNVVSSGTCATIGREYHRPTHWTMFYGCYVRLPDGRSIQSGRLQAFQQVGGR